MQRLCRGSRQSLPLNTEPGIFSLPGFAKKSDGVLRRASATSIVILGLNIAQYEACLGKLLICSGLHIHGEES